MQHDRTAGCQTPPEDPNSSTRPGPSAALSAFPILLTEDQAAALLGVSVRKFAELRHEAWMPRPVQLGPRLLRFVRQELEQAAVSAMPRQAAPGPQPAQLLRGRIEKLKNGGQPVVTTESAGSRGR